MTATQAGGAALAARAPAEALSSTNPLRPSLLEGGLGLSSPPLSALQSGGFAAELERLVGDARGRAAVSQESVEAFARTEQPGRIHEVLIAATKAEISLRTLVTVRNKLVDAYKDLLHVTT